MEKELTSEQITKAYVDRINEKEKDVQAFITLTTSKAIEESKKIDAERDIEKHENNETCFYT